MPSTKELIRKSLAQSEALLTRMNSDRDLLAAIEEATEVWARCLKDGGRIYLAGNGGSAADCQHIAGELVSRFNFERPALPAIALTVDTSILTAIGNDYGFEQVFRRQLEAYAKPGDVFVGLSTSGNSSNVVRALTYAQSNGITTVGMTGTRGGRMNEFCDTLIEIPHNETPRIQEGHILTAHAICAAVEIALFANRPFAHQQAV